MDEGANRLGRDPAARTAALENEAAALRERLDTLLDELDRRRRRARADLSKLRRYGVPTILGAALLAGAISAFVSYRRRPRSRLQRALRAARARVS